MGVHTAFIRSQLIKLPPERGYEPHEHHGMLRCPFHGGGKERTASLKLNLDTEEGYKTGSWVCFGCGRHGEWREFAQATGLKSGKKFEDDIFDLYTSKLKKHQLLGSDSEELDLRPEVRLSPDWEPDKKWRGISGKLLSRLHAKRIINQYGERMFLPVIINKQPVGGITCLLKKQPNFPSYINEPGQWIRSTLFPFDYTKRLLKKYNRRVVMIGEGPRDALNPLQYGMPALTNLGGTTVWTKDKAELLMTLDPELIVIATDPDEIGNQLYEMIKGHFDLQIKTTRLKFPPYVKGKTEKKDPGNMSKERIRAMMQRLNLRRI